MKKYRVYVWMVIAAVAGFGLSWVIPGMEPGAGIAIGTAVGLVIGTEDVACHFPWQANRRHASKDHRAE